METMVFNMKNFPTELHRQAKIAAVKEGKALKDWMIEAVKEKLERSKETQ